jgi:hypothetical protein
MPEKIYRSPNGKVTTETELRSHYGDKFESVRSNFTEVSGSVYKTPNGKLATEDELKSHYGGKFESVKSNFELISDVKKKEPTASSSRQGATPGSLDTQPKGTTKPSGSLELKDEGVYTFSGRPGVNYKKTSDNRWLIDVKNTGNFVEIKSPERTAILEKKASRVFGSPFEQEDTKFEQAPAIKKVEPTIAQKEEQKVFETSFKALAPDDPIVLAKKERDQKLSSALKQIDDKLIGSSEENAIVRLRKILDNSGVDMSMFKLEETQIGDAIRITNTDTGEHKDISLNNLSDSPVSEFFSKLHPAAWFIDSDEKSARDKEEANILKGFIEVNTKFADLGKKKAELKRLEVEVQGKPLIQRAPIEKRMDDLRKEIGVDENRRKEWALGDKYTASAVYNKTDIANIKTEQSRVHTKAMALKVQADELAQYKKETDELLANNQISIDEYNEKYLPTIAREAEKLDIESMDLRQSASNLRSQSSHLEELAGHNIAVQGERGNLLSGTTRAFAQGVESVIRFGIEGTSNLDPMERGTIADMFSPGVTTSEYMTSKDRSLFEKAIFGITESIGASITGSIITGGAGNLPGMFASSYMNAKDQFDTPEMANIPEYKKILYSATVGAVIAKLEDIGLGSVFKKSPVINKLTNYVIGKTFKDLPKNATAEAIELAINENLKLATSRGLLKALSGGATEAVTEALQELTSITAENTFNIMEGKGYFDSPNTAAGILDRMSESAKLGMIGGSFMGSISQAVRVSKDRMTMGQLNDLQALIENEDLLDIYKLELKGKVMTGAISKADAVTQLTRISESQALLKQIPPNTTPENKYKAFKLISESDRINKEIEGKDKSLVKDQRERLIAIENELEIIGGYETKQTEKTDNEASIETETSKPKSEEVLTEEEATIVPEETVSEEVLTEEEATIALSAINRPATLSSFGGVKLDAPLSGDVYLDGQQIVFEDRDSGKIYELGNVNETSTLEGVELQAERIIVTNSGELSIDGKNWTIQSELPTSGIEYNPAGEVLSVSLRDSNNNRTMIKGQDAVDAAYHIELQKFQTQEQIDKVNEQLEKDERFKEEVRQLKLTEDVAKKDTIKDTTQHKEGATKTLDDLKSLDVSDQSNLQAVQSYLNKALDDLDAFGKETLGMNLSVVVAKAVIKSIKLLVDAGVSLDQAIKRASEEHKVKEQDVYDTMYSMTEAQKRKATERITGEKQPATRATEKSKEAKAISSKPSKKVLVNEYQALKTQLRFESRAAREATGAVNNKRKEVKRFIKNLYSQSKITAKQSEVIINKLNSIDFLKDESVHKFMVYVNNVFNEDMKMPDPVKAAKTISSKPSKKVLINEYQALKIQLRFESKAAREAVGAVNNKRKEVHNHIKELYSKAKLTKNQAKVMINKLGKVNFLKEKSVAAFEAYADKIFNDAEYADKLVNANELKSAISKSHKSDSNQAQVSNTAKMFSKLSPKYVEDLDEYNEIAQSVLDSVRVSKVSDSGARTRQAVNLAVVKEYTAKQSKVEAEFRKNELLEIHKELEELGVLSKDMTIDHIRSIIESIDIEETVLDENTEAKIREYINTAFDLYSAAIDELIEDGDYSDSHVNIIQKVMSMDINKMPINDAYRIVEALDNFIMNGIIDGLAARVAVNEGVNNAAALLKKGITAKALRLLGSKGIGRFDAVQFGTIPLLSELLFGGVNNAIAVNEANGVRGIQSGYAKASRAHTQILDKYIDRFKKRKANGTDFNTVENSFERGAIANLKRTVFGTKEEQVAELKRNIDIINDSIDALSDPTATPEEVRRGEIYQELAKKLGLDKEGVTINEIIAKADPVNNEAVDWWINEWGNHYDKFADISLSMWNKELLRDDNYTANRYSSLESKSLRQDDLLDDSTFTPSVTLDKKAAGSMQAVSRPSGIKGKYVNLDFDSVQSSSLIDALVKTETAEDTFKLSGFLRSKGIDGIFGRNVKDKRLYINRLIDYQRDLNNKSESGMQEIKDITKGLNILSALGSTYVLAGFTQPLKQTVPLMLGTVTASGRFDTLNFFDKDVADWVKNSNMSIAIRGAEASTAIESVHKKLEKKNRLVKNKASDALDEAKKLSEASLKAFLANPDVFIAVKAFASYYKQYMRKNGLPTELVEGEYNQDALNYAQQMVDRQQNVSDPAMAGRMFSSKKPHVQALKKMIIPLSGFVMNQKKKIHSDLRVLTSPKTSSMEDIITATKSLASTTVEMAAYQATIYYIGLGIQGLAMSAMGYKETDEEKEKRKKFKWNYARDSAIRDVLSPAPPLDGLTIATADWLSSNIYDAVDYLYGNKDLDKLIEEKEKERLEDDKLPLTFLELKKIKDEWEDGHRATFKNFDNEHLLQFGLLTIAVDKILDMKELVSMYKTGVVDKEINGRMVTKIITDEDREKLALQVALSSLSFIPGPFTEVSNEVRRAKKIAEKNALTDRENTNYRAIKDKYGKIEDYQLYMVRNSKVGTEGLLDMIDDINKEGGFDSNDQVDKYFEIYKRDESVSSKEIREIKNRP